MVQLHDGVIIAKFPLDKPEVRIGRDPDSDIFIDDKVVSLAHAVVEVVAEPDRLNNRKYFIRDLGSSKQHLCQ